MNRQNKITNSHNEKLDAEVIDYQLRQEDGKIYLETIYLVIFCGSLEIGHEYHYIVSCSGLKEEEKITNTQSTYNPNTCKYQQLLNSYGHVI